MIINGVTIKDFEKKLAQQGSRETRSLYRGTFSCKGKALDQKGFCQVSTTKVARYNEYGVAEWCDPVTEFRVFGHIIPFPTLKELIDFYNNERQMRTVKLRGITFSVSECGTVVMVGEKRKRILTHKLPKQRLLYNVNAGDRTWNVRRLVALAWLPKPPQPKMRVLLKDGDESNIHYTNLYWNVGSHTPEEAQECAKYLNK